MRPASIGPVKHLIRRISIVELARVIEEAEAEGLTSVRGPVTAWLARQ
jgi:phosphotransferase system enzyme I (PtsP)